MTPFPDRLRAWRTEAAMSQRTLARKSGCSVGTILRWEYGRSEPTVTDLARLEQALGLNPGDLADPSVVPEDLDAPLPPVSRASKARSDAAVARREAQRIVDFSEELRGLADALATSASVILDRLSGWPSEEEVASHMLLGRVPVPTPEAAQPEDPEDVAREIGEAVRQEEPPPGEETAGRPASPRRAPKRESA